MKKNWEVKRLGDVASFQRGLTYSKKDEVDFSSNIVLRANNIDLKTNALDFSELKYINDDFVIPKEKKVTKGSLIICTASGSKSHLGKIALIDDDYDYAFGGFMGQLNPSNNIDSKYLFHLLTSDAYKTFINKLSDGVNINNLRFDDLSAFPIPLPPLPEQQCIVAILDEAFAAIATAKENAEKNLQNARELFESYLQSVFANPGDGWEEKKLGEVCENVEYGTSAKSQKTGKIPVLRMGNIQDSRLDWNDLVYTSDDEEIQKYTLKNNDILFNRTNSEELVGKTAIYKGERPAIFAGYLIRIIIKKALVDADFLNICLNSKKLREYGFSVMTSSVNQANISGSKLKEYPVILPSLPEQQRIVAKLDALSAETKKLEAIYQQKLADLDELKKSVLQKAFSGDL